MNWWKKLVAFVSVGSFCLLANPSFAVTPLTQQDKSASPVSSQPDFGALGAGFCADGTPYPPPGC